ncbi:hypothetical protein FIU86_16075 [Roseovarius sp. THAF9]|uniref:hypothetical protein n=1 Tax=Roseovarius sp. THAF9 TaxID=2587847 RepID=UPI0012689472|nr:hypothetical protein [Roseovarius sp. THAF9]QFT94367.1 hypothetical protein FIU86_16075 [Roseovarius sp. THAF9]
MSNSPNSESDTWRVSAEETRRDYTSFALAGLRARHYAGVFHRVERAKNPTFLATILLDGFERALEVKFTSVPKTGGNVLIQGQLSGLPLSENHRRFDFCRDVEAPYRAQGIISLTGATLSIGILPARSADGSRIYVCHLEIVRDHA